MKITSSRNIAFQNTREGRNYFVLKAYRKGTVINFNTVPDAEVKMRAKDFPDKLHYLERMIEVLYSELKKQNIENFEIKAMYE